MSVAAVFMQPEQASAASKKKVVITIGGKKFNAELNNSKTAKAFMKHLPATYTMKLFYFKGANQRRDRFKRIEMRRYGEQIALTTQK